MTTPNFLDNTNQSTPNVPDSVSDVCASRSTAGYRWKRIIELGYDESYDDGRGEREGDGRNNDATVEDSLIGDDVPACFHCGRVSNGLMKCGRCHVANYCSRECQVSNWKGEDGKVGHKFSCAGEYYYYDIINRLCFYFYFFRTDK
jgi:hypothetical protein